MLVSRLAARAPALRQLHTTTRLRSGHGDYNVWPSSHLRPQKKIERLMPLASALRSPFPGREKCTLWSQDGRLFNRRIRYPLRGCRVSAVRHVHWHQRFSRANILFPAQRRLEQCLSYGF